ncbi:MAG TPA: PAS domain-containing protein, partial [Phenylobacterium sp.]
MPALFRRQKKETGPSRLEHLETMFEALGNGQGFLEFDADKTVISANKMFLTWAGYEPEEVLGKDSNMFLFPEQRGPEAEKAFWGQLLAGKTVSDKFRMRAKGEREWYFYGTFYPIIDRAGKYSRFVLIGAEFTAVIVAKREADER